MSERKYFCFCEANCRFETMTKEQILTAITQAAESGAIHDVDAGFVTKVKEANAGGYVTFWVGTTAQYNALPEKDPNCMYIFTDGVSIAELEAVAKKASTDAAEAVTTAAAANEAAAAANEAAAAAQETADAAASASHEHSAEDVTSGTLPMARGGTGATTAVDAVDALGALNLKNIEDDDHLIASGDNLNDYTTAGAYRCATTAIASSLSNAPSYTSAGFRLLVSSLSTNTSRIQIAIFNSGQSRVYYRHLTSSGTWTPWTRMLTDVLVENSDYGDSLPAAGTKGRIFFKKV